MIEAHEDRTRDWRHAYQTRVRDISKRLEQERAEGFNQLRDWQIGLEARSSAERQVNMAINMHNEQIELAARRKRHNPAPVDDMMELPRINTARDIDDPGIVEDITDY